MSAAKNKKFSIKHTFENAKNIKKGENRYGKEENHFGRSWKIFIYKDVIIGSINIYLECSNSAETSEISNWKIKAKASAKFQNKTSGTKKYFNSRACFAPNSCFLTFPETLKVDELENYLMIDGNLTIDIHVEITKMSGILVEDSMEKEVPDIQKSPITISPPVFKKKFVLKHNFLDVMKMNQYSFGKLENRFGIPWRIYIYRTGDGISAYFECLKIRGISDWWIQTEFEWKLVSELGFFSKNLASHRFGSRKKMESTHGPVKFSLKEFQPFLIDGNLKIECHVKMIKARGIKDKLKKFNKKEFSDVALVVNEEKFYVLKKYLSSHCTYFKTLLHGYSDRSEVTEITLKDIDPYDFQMFLELIHGESEVNEFTVKIILHLADMFDSKSAIRRCEEFLINKSKRSLKMKFELAVGFNLDNLKKKCLSEIKSTKNIRHVLPKDVNKFQPAIWAELLNLSVSFN